MSSGKRAKNARGTGRAFIRPTVGSHAALCGLGGDVRHPGLAVAVRRLPIGVCNMQSVSSSPEGQSPEIAGVAREFVPRMEARSPGVSIVAGDLSKSACGIGVSNHSTNAHRRRDLGGVLGHDSGG